MRQCGSLARRTTYDDRIGTSRDLFVYQLFEFLIVDTAVLVKRVTIATPAPLKIAIHILPFCFACKSMLLIPDRRSASIAFII